MKYIIIAGVVIVLGFLIALQFIPLGIEPLTEVYFENHTKLPNVIFLNKTYNFTFTVHNLEYMPMDYKYNIDAEFLGGNFNMDSGTFSLQNNESTQITENFQFHDHFEKAKIRIEISRLKDNPLQRDPNLKNQTIDIHFWIEEYVPTKIIITPD